LIGVYGEGTGVQEFGSSEATIGDFPAPKARQFFNPGVGLEEILVSREKK
jgi:hypothetical protein